MSMPLPLLLLLRSYHSPDRRLFDRNHRPEEATEVQRPGDVAKIKTHGRARRPSMVSLYNLLG